MTYQFFEKRQNKIFKIRRYGRVPRVKSAKVGIDIDAEAERLPDVIQGVSVDSKEEARVALALDQLKLPYEYQKEVFGGKRTRGGSVVDFWVYTTPYATPIYIQGKYWHRLSRSYNDTIIIEKLKNYYRGYINEPLLINAIDMLSVKKAYYFLRDLLL